jgi:glutathione S-transferase
MKKLNFHGSQLCISLRSPFARRVRLAFLEHGIEFTEKVYDVFQENPDLFDLNPLGRIPVLQLKSGDILGDSNYILQLFYGSIDSPLSPKNDQEKIDIAYWQFISVGVCEKLVEFFLDSKKEPNLVDPQIEQELKTISGRIFHKLEKRLTESNSSFLACDKLTQADLDLGTALDYYDLRYSTSWKEEFPKLALYQADLRLRPSLQKTAPPK